MTLNTAKPFLLAMLPVRNEADRYLKTALTHLSEYVDGIVILDDASTDETPRICQNFSKVISFHRLDESLFGKDESILRRILWEMTVDLDPDWILALDADEIFESSIKNELLSLTRQNKNDLVYFPIYHFWGSLTHYRTDGLWNPLFSKIACLYRYLKNKNYHWPDRKLHCGRFPIEAYVQPATLATIRILHLGYARKAEHQSKYNRYLAIDPGGRFCPMAHYQSILESPQLKQWTGEKLKEF